MTRSGFTGPRGRYVPEYPGVKEYQAAGVPPVLAPFEPLNVLPKDTAIPPVPHQMTRVVDFPVSVATGRLLDRDAGHPIHTIQLDNYSKQWLYCPSAARYVMPYCTGVQFPIYSGSSKIQIDAAAPPGITQPALAGTTQVFAITCYEALKEYSPGLSVLNAGALP
jgi:hypothetical protein